MGDQDGTADGGQVTYVDANVQHAEVLKALDTGSAAVVKSLRRIGFEIIRLDAGAAPVPQSQHPKLRVDVILVNPVTAGLLRLMVGESSYDFDGAARSLVPIPFPIVIERGVNLSCIGADGRLYLIGLPE